MQHSLLQPGLETVEIVMYIREIMYIRETVEIMYIKETVEIMYFSQMECQRLKEMSCLS
jgi:hypothetical protein